MELTSNNSYITYTAPKGGIVRTVVTVTEYNEAGNIVKETITETEYEQIVQPIVQPAPYQPYQPYKQPYVTSIQPCTTINLDDPA
jgi:hypothetical protein